MLPEGFHMEKLDGEVRGTSRVCITKEQQAELILFIMESEPTC